MKYFLVLLSLILSPLTAFAKGNGPDIGSVMYSNPQANISTALSASVNSSVGVLSCHLYVDSEDIGAMNLTPSTANMSYTFPRGGVFTVFVFCRDQNGGMSSGPNTSILVSGDIVSQPIYSGGNSDPNPTPSNPIPEQSTNQTATSTVASIPTGSLIKLNCPANAQTDHPCKTVYYYGKDLKRHAFPNAQAYFTWYENFDAVTSTDEATISQIPLGKNVTYRPGKKMVKFQTVDRVYAVSRGGTLQWITSEALATILYGSDWNKQIDDISDAFYTNYTFGNDIAGISDFSPTNELNSAPTIDDSIR